MGYRVTLLPTREVLQAQDLDFSVAEFILSYHAQAERHRQMKMDFPRLMVRQAHHERLVSRSP